MLEELKGKIVVVTNINFAGSIVLFEDYSDNFIKVKNSCDAIFYFPIYNIAQICLAVKEDMEKYKDYLKKFKENPNFTGDLEKDDGGIFG